ncbi:APC family permease [Sinosporangium siamense]|uniref:APC family permease n=1 Tax=Sinosporangium siamense TaxID=1367973 RepID=A0A919RK14_9ACTN|nr:APC family permease [Sinosporangium siamense]GII95203.1 hypothetical protein Ssi02_54340 [Sinosporangium siamense]
MATPTGPARPRPTKIGFFRNVAQPLSVSGPSSGTAVLPAVMVAVTGTAGATSFLLGVLAGGLVVYIFASLAKHFSSAGAAYYYAGVLSGMRVAVVVGWTYLLTYLGFAACVLSNEANYFGVAMGYVSGPEIPWVLVAVALWVLCVYVVARGIEFSTRFQVALEVLGVLSLVLIGVTVLVKGGYGGSNLSLAAFSLDGVTPGKLFLGMALALGTFGGFESGASLSEETDSPGRTVPAGMWTTLLLSGGLYVFASWFINVGFPDLDTLAASPAPLFELAEQHFGSTVAFVMTVVVLLAGLSTITAASNGAVRTLFAMRRDAARSGGGSLSEPERIPVRLVALCAVPILVLSAGFFWTEAYMAFQYVATAAALLITAIYLCISLLSVRWFARLGSPAKAGVGVLACAVLGYSLYSSVASQTDPVFRALAFVDLGLVLLAVVFVLVAKPVVRRMDASVHWEAGREIRDRLLAADAAPPAAVGQEVGGGR